MTDSTSVESDEKWSKLTLLGLMSGLAEYAEDNSLERLSVDEKKELDKLRGKSTSYGSRLSNVANFMGSSVTRIVDMIQQRLDGMTKSDTNYIALSRRINKVLEIEDYRIRSFLPNFSENRLYRWPGLISYRLYLNHFVSFSLRLHSIYPEAPFDKVTSLVASVIITPSIAHNLSFVSKTHPALFRALVKVNSADSNSVAALVRLSEESDSHEIRPPKDLTDIDKTLFRKWILLLKAFIANHPDRIEAKRQILKIVELLQDYEDNLTNSTLWSNLEFIASGDFTMDELLVAKVIEKGDTVFNSIKLNPIVSCAQSRFGLLRYIDTLPRKQRREEIQSSPQKVFEEAAKSIEAHEKYAYPENTDQKQAQELFGWAYILSRRNLLGRLNQEPKKLKDDTNIRKISSILATEFKAEEYLNRIFNSLTRESVLNVKSSARNYGLLALRYLAGFKSNPRFIIDTRGVDNTNYIEVLIERLKKIDKSDVPPAIISMLKARNYLHKAFLSKRKKNTKEEIHNLNQSLKCYSECLNYIFLNQGVMDGEVAAWCIPEMITVFRFKQDHAESKKQIRDIDNLIDALTLVGEYQFGIYFNPLDERERIELGLKIRCSPRFA